MAKRLPLSREPRKRGSYRLTEATSGSSLAYQPRSLPHGGIKRGGASPLLFAPRNKVLATTPRALRLIIFRPSFARCNLFARLFRRTRFTRASCFFRGSGLFRNRLATRFGSKIWFLDYFSLCGLGDSCRLTFRYAPHRREFEPQAAQPLHSLLATKNPQRIANGAGWVTIHQGIIPTRHRLRQRHRAADLNTGRSIDHAERRALLHARDPYGIRSARVRRRTLSRSRRHRRRARIRRG